MDNNYQDNTNVQYQTPTQSEPNKANGLQIGGLVCGILAICTSCCYGIPGVLLGISGLVCSIIGNKKGKTGVGTAGIVCSIIGLLLGLIALAFWAFVFVAGFQAYDAMNITNMSELMQSEDFWSQMNN